MREGRVGDADTAKAFNNDAMRDRFLATFRVEAEEHLLATE